jgi:hypothetical protein
VGVVEVSVRLGEGRGEPRFILGNGRFIRLDRGRPRKVVTICWGGGD